MAPKSVRFPGWQWAAIEAEARRQFGEEGHASRFLRRIVTEYLLKLQAGRRRAANTKGRLEGHV